MSSRSLPRDIVIGAVDGERWPQLAVWAHSLIECGFQGARVVVLYEGHEENDDVAHRLRSLGFHVVAFPRHSGAFVDRFQGISEMLGMAARFLRYAIVTDIRDTYFQSDPVPWLQADLTAPILAVSEAVRYRDEPRSRENLIRSFPTQAERILPKTVCDAGVLAGEAATIADLCAAIPLVAGSSSHTEAADQSAYNLILDMEPYRSAVQIAYSEDGFACPAGTLAAPGRPADLRAALLEPEPVLDGDRVTTAAGKLYPIVRHCGRVPEWHRALVGALAERMNAAAGHGAPARAR